MKWTIRIILLCLVAFTIWYHIPTKHTIELNLSTFQKEHQTTQVTLNIKKHKSFFKPTYLTGELIHEGRTFKSLESDRGYDWVKKLNGKLSGTMFILEDTDYRNIFNEDYWQIIHGNSNLEALLISQNINGEFIGYTGPATNEEEATKMFYNIFNYKD